MALEKLLCAPVHLTVWAVIFATDTVKITVHTVKCTGAHRDYSNAVSCVKKKIGFKFGKCNWKGNNFGNC